MEQMAGEYGISYGSEPPYEVLSTRWLDYGEILRLKGVEAVSYTHLESRQPDQPFPGPGRDDDQWPHAV